jgi:hypothetical protein
MTKEKPFPKLPPVFKKTFLKSLKEGCYVFTTNEWYKKLDKVKKNKKGVVQEYAYCTLGAAYHHAIGKNTTSPGHTGIPDTFKDNRVTDAIMELNDKSKSFKPTIRWIEKNL